MVCHGNHRDEMTMDHMDPVTSSNAPNFFAAAQHPARLTCCFRRNAETKAAEVLQDSQFDYFCQVVGSMACGLV